LWQTGLGLSDMMTSMVNFTVRISSIFSIITAKADPGLLLFDGAR